jgi:hypothetical protein
MHNITTERRGWQVALFVYSRHFRLSSNYVSFSLENLSLRDHKSLVQFHHTCPCGNKRNRRRTRQRFKMMKGDERGLRLPFFESLSFLIFESLSFRSLF